MKNIYLLFALAILSMQVTKAEQRKKPATTTQYVILDTDMGNDVDDVLAMDILYKYMDKGKIKLLATMTNKNGDTSARFLDIMNTWYGYPNIPIGVVRNGAKCDNDNNYTIPISNMKENGQPMFKTTVPDVTKLPDAEILYRKILASMPDHSVIIISVGFSTNLARLLDTKGDQYSPLTGKQLIAKKVKYLSLMAGNFNERHLKEFNVVLDIPSCAKLFAECPVPIITSPFELGGAIQYPGKSIQNDFKWAKQHPLVKAYEYYKKMPYDRATWDLTAVLQVVEPGKYMTKSPAGNIFVDSEGHTYYNKSMDGQHYYLTVTPEQAKRIRNFFLNLIPQKPKNRK